MKCSRNNEHPSNNGHNGRDAGLRHDHGVHYTVRQLHLATEPDEEVLRQRIDCQHGAHADDGDPPENWTGQGGERDL